MPPTQMPINRSNVGPDGTVKVWDIPAKEWRQVPYVDAREMQEAGTASLNGPNVVMQGPAGQGEITVCEAEVKGYEARGFTRVRKVAAPQPPAGNIAPAGQAGSSGGDGSGDSMPDRLGGGAEPYNFEAHTINELRAFAAQAKLENAGAMNKAALVQALTTAGFRPSSKE